MVTPDKKHLDRLYWRCRRGMLELDTLLQGFLQNGIDLLDSAGVQGFEDLLETPDNVLLEYLMGRTTPIDPMLAYVVQQIRQAH